MTRSVCSDTLKGGKGCGAPIVWVPTRWGRAMPLDETPGLRAALDANPEATWEDLRSADLGGDKLVPHWATCPHAATHRTKQLWRHLPR